MRYQSPIERLLVLIFVVSAAVAGPAIAVPSDPSDSPENTADPVNLIEQLLRDEMTAPVGLPLPSISNEQQALRAIDNLVAGLRNRGDLAAITTQAPTIRQVLPDNPTVRYLHAISLAASGNAGMAEKAIVGLSAAGEDRFYAAAAEAMIAKARRDIARAMGSARTAMDLDGSHPLPHNIVGQVHVAQNQLDLAVASFRRAIELGPNQAAARSNLAATFFLLGRTDEAYEAYNRALETSPGFCPARIGRATIHEQRRAYDAAVADLEKCAILPGSSNAARERLVNAYLLAGQAAEAKSLAETLSNSNPVFARTAIGDAELRLGNAAAARDVLEPISGSSDQATYLLGFSDLLENDANSAAERFESLIGEAPDRAGARLAAAVTRFYFGTSSDPESLSALADDPQVGSFGEFIGGAVQAADGDWGTAYELWSRADGVVPGYTLAGVDSNALAGNLSTAEQRHIAMGMLFYLRQMYGPAASQFDDALAENRDSFLAHYLKSVMHTELGEMDLAATHLKKSRAALDTFFPVNFSLAEISLSRGETEEAIGFYEAAVTDVPHAGVLVRLGLLYEGEGDRDNAERAYRRFLEVQPNSYIANNQLAWFYAKRGEQLEEAYKLARRANELNPGNISINDTLGWIHYQWKEFDAALEYLEEANRIAQGQNPDVLFHIAAVKSATGDKSSATAMLEELLSKHTRFESLEEARELQASLAGSEG